METHGWSFDDGAVTFGGRVVCAAVRPPFLDRTWWLVRVWPRLGPASGAGLHPTKPLGPECEGLRFETEADARAYVESWEQWPSMHGVP